MDYEYLVGWKYVFCLSLSKCLSKHNFCCKVDISFSTLDDGGTALLRMNMASGTRADGVGGIGGTSFLQVQAPGGDLDNDSYPSTNKISNGTIQLILQAQCCVDIVKRKFQLNCNQQLAPSFHVLASLVHHHQKYLLAEAHQG